MWLPSLLIGCQCGEPRPGQPTPFEAMVYADRVGDTRSFGVRVRQKGPFEALGTTPRDDGPWIEVRTSGEGASAEVNALDVVLPTPDAVDLIKTYWIHPAVVEEVATAPTGLSTWIDAPTRLTIWYPANSTLVMLWEPVQPGAFTPRLTMRPHFKMTALNPLFASCEPYGMTFGPAQSLTPYSVGPFDSTPQLSIGPETIVWRSRGPADRHASTLAMWFTAAMGESVDGRWACREGEGSYTMSEGDDGWVTVTLRKGRT